MRATASMPLRLLRIVRFVLRPSPQTCLLVLLATVFGCASPGTREPSPLRQHLGFVFPEEVGALSMQDYEEYEERLYGAVANYKLGPSDMLIVSVFVFPAPRFEDGSIQPIEEHARDELRGLIIHYESARQVDWPPELAYATAEGRVVYQAALEIDHPDFGLTHSLLIVEEIGDARLKLRISYPVSHPDAPIHVRRFLEEIL